LADGTIEIGMVRDGQSMQVDTPSVTVRTHEAGDVRISIAADGSSWVTARRGSADVVTPQRAYTIDTGTTLSARGSASNPSVAYSPEVAFDSFDDFNAQRDRAMLAALSANPNLNPALAGFDNLDDYGHWQAVAGYGQSWVPNEPAGWVPYRNGSWAWEGGYGWTWIGSEPWGWAPYHYGNWYYCDCGASGWAWLPPSHASTPSWSPALVGFFGFDVASAGSYNNCGGNYGYAPSSSGAPPAPSNTVAQGAPAGPAAPYSPGAPAPYGEGGPGPAPAAPYGVGGPGYAPQGGYPYPYIGWVPIAPYEPFYPWYPGWAWLGFGWGLPFYGGYGYPAGFATRITNITNITNVYRNFRHGGATAARTRDFRHGTVSGHTVAVTRRDLGRHVGTIHGALPVAPTRNSLAFSHGAVHAPVKFSKAFNSPRFASERALAARTSFAQQQKVVAQAIHGGVTGHAPTHTALRHTSAPIAHATRTEAHARVPQTQAHANSFQAPRQFAVNRRQNASAARENVPAMRAAAPAMRSENEAPARESSAGMRENGAPMRENNAPMRENREMLEGSATSRQGGAARNESAPATSWDRFNEARGEARPAEFPGGSGGLNSARDIRGEGSAPGETGRDDRAPSDSWGRFSTSRGESYDGTRSQYEGRNPYDEGETMRSGEREMPSYSRGSYGSPYSRESYPSYSRGSYGSPYSRESYPSYSRGSYPSYSRGSYPSYSHESYPSYSRGSYPSYPRGSYGSAPSYSRGYSAPRSSGGGGGGGAHHGGGGRPPH